MVLVGCQVKEERKKRLSPPHPIPESFPQESAQQEKTLSCQGIFFFLSQTGNGQKRLRVLPFDLQELEAWPSLSAAIPDTEQSLASPRLPGTSREIVWSRGLLTVSISPPGCLESVSGQRICSGKGKPEQGLGNVGGGGCAVWGMGPAYTQPFLGHCYFR